MNHPIFNCYDERYKKPFGAIECCSNCEFTLRFPINLMLDEPTLVIYRQGFKDRYIPLEFKAIINGLAEYSCTYQPQDMGLHFYYFTLLIDGHRRYVKKRGLSEGVLEGEDVFQLTVYEKGMDTPDWLKGGVMYQIFPDRFASSKTKYENVPEDRRLHECWNDTPDWRPDYAGKITNSDYFGGDLRGIEQKLDYLEKLGVTVIYLNPIFEAHENHRYNTANYEKIDPLLGTEEDFERLCASAKKKGIRIILDGVFSHTGADSIYFNKSGRYGDHTGAFRNPDSEYREWYSFIKYPNEYESWWGITTLPNVNENNPAYTKYICGDGGILQRWIDRGASGWRLDVADELPDEFIDNLHKSVKTKGEDKVIYGEVWEDASNKESYGVRRRYLIGGQLDSVMNYPFKESILNYVKNSNPNDLIGGIMPIIEHYPKPSTDILMNFLSTHDTERAITRLAGDEIGWNGRDWQAERYLTPQQYVYGVTLMKCAMVLQFFMPGIPCVYYGDEAGQEGYKDPFNRRTYPWGKEDGSLIDFTAELAAIRKSSSAFVGGILKFIEVTPEHCIFSRTNPDNGETAIIVLNKSKTAYKYDVLSLIGKCTEYRYTRRKSSFIPPFDYEVILAK